MGRQTGCGRISGQILAYIGERPHTALELRTRYLKEWGPLSENTLRMTLARLRRAGMVVSDREGKRAVYRRPAQEAAAARRRPDEWY